MHRVPSQFWFLVRFTCLGKNPKFLNVHRWIPSVGSRCGITERDGGRAWRSKPLLGKSLLEDRKYVFLQYNALKAINLPDDEKPVMLFFPGNVFWLPDQGSIWLLLISLSFFFLIILSYLHISWVLGFFWPGVGSFYSLRQRPKQKDGIISTPVYLKDFYLQFPYILSPLDYTPLL